MECYYQLSGQSLSAKTMMCSPINLKFECDSMINVSTIDQHHPHNAAEILGSNTGPSQQLSVISLGIPLQLHCGILIHRFFETLRYIRYICSINIMMRSPNNLNFECDSMICRQHDLYLSSKVSLVPWDLTSSLKMNTTNQIYSI